MTLTSARLSPVRLSALTDMLCTHIVWGRTGKALKIAQYLRREAGMYLIPNLENRTGHRRAKAEVN